VGLLATAHGWSRPGSDAKLRFYNRVDRYALRRFPLVLAVSESQRNLLRSAGVSDANIRVVPNGIDLDRWRPGEGGGIPPGVPAEGPRVGTVLRLSADKDVEGLIDAFAGLPGSPRLVIVGDGPLRGELERRAAASGAGERIVFLGRREDVAGVLAHLDLFVLPTRAEGLPNSVLEAMALARPIVAHRVGGVPELVRDGEEALLVAPGDTAGLGAALERLLADEGLARRLAGAARRRVEEEFSFSARLARLEDIYERIATGGPDGGDAA
jgi:glycosyltransferase involved in cell wall biosynthesis